ncbi:2-hydroxyacid dehydrogenase [Lentimicrobium sp.]
MINQVLFIDTTHPYLAESLQDAGFKCSHYTGNSRQEILDMLRHYQGLIIRSKIKLDRDAIERAVQAKFIARVGAGMENIDASYAGSKGIICLNAPEGNRDAVGEHAIGMLLSLFNHLCRANQEVRQGIWIREGNRGIELGGKTIGIIGYGNTGRAFAEKLSGFNVKVLAFDKYKTGFSGLFVKEVDMQELFRETDVLSLHVPLTDETRQLVNRDFLNSFHKPVFVINTSRGQCVDTAALMDAIDQGRVEGAALDVLEYEKLSFENLDAENLPLPFKRLIASEKVMLSPHIAGWTHESNYKMAKILADKIKALYAGSD